MARPSRRPGNLPAESTTFVGRRRELVELKKTLATARLVSLVGPGGVGKTRLAIRLGTEIGRSFRDGAWLVELAELNEPALVPNAVLSALDLRDQTAAEPLALLLSNLRDKELLLVIDNCEHLVVACGSMVMQILTSASRVRVVTTSREPLSIEGEYVQPVSPLGLPDAEGKEPLSKVLQNEAIKLFVDRATAASGTFELTEANQAAVAQLCRRLDGLPLAIELAAVRTRVLSVDQILDRLTDRFGLLTGGSRAALPRHHTLRTTIDWSYELLSTSERAVLRRLAVFAGSFALEAVESVCAFDDVPDPDVLDVLSSLVDKSLVVKYDQARSARYRLHETMREYAQHKLREVGEEADTRNRHAGYYTSVCPRFLAIEEAGFEVIKWLEWADAEIDNIRAVLQRCLQASDYSLGVALAASLNWYWATRATSEGVRWLDEFLSHAQGDPAILTQAYFVRGVLATGQSEPVAADTAFSQAAALARASGDLRLLALTLTAASFTQNLAGEHARATQLANDASILLDTLDDDVAVAWLHNSQGLNAQLDGDLERAKRLFMDSVDRFRTRGLLWGLEHCLSNLGSICLVLGQLEESDAVLKEALSIACRLDDRMLQVYLFDSFGWHAAASENARLAARFLGAGEKTRAEIGASVFPLSGALRGLITEVAISDLGVERFEAEFKVGTNLSREEAVSLALGRSARSATETEGRTRGAVLGKREADVARLVAEGLSNRQIGARLFISDRTVESHVRSILNKLGFNSRAQIAGWIASSN